ncbi:UreD-domain-containing protein [Myriangium duriaei CBS 260.36]|uniref:UreD-domain-containing protein n=1 Tax=Myriangium duriaei CBS 260.36 TaxID=1168546 RepID=A0A9P4J917_9PEZI|nr:UreD-domain-containing protein [Myriangium duriaei CBS 260.36]
MTKTKSKNPFLQPPATPGNGTVHLTHIPPSTLALSTLTYHYPLKLIAPTPLQSSDSLPVQTLYLLSYGGGILASDTLSLSIHQSPLTRLLLLTQGSTKIFKSPSPERLSRQRLDVKLDPGAALCQLPDPVQPFADSAFAQRQTYRLPSPGGGGGSGEGKASLCVLDWVCQGRAARGERWDMRQYESRSDVLEGDGTAEKLLVRDSLALRRTESGRRVDELMQGLGVYGTLVLYGPLMEGLGEYFHAEFRAMPRIGSRKWDDGGEDEGEESEDEVRRAARLGEEGRDGLLWSVASLRGCTVVKFGARDVEGGKRWLRTMLEVEGSVVKYFGERALLCLK